MFFNFIVFLKIKKIILYNNKWYIINNHLPQSIARINKGRTDTEDIKKNIFNFFKLLVFLKILKKKTSLFIKRYFFF